MNKPQALNFALADVSAELVSVSLIRAAVSLNASGTHAVLFSSSSQWSWADEVASAGVNGRRSGLYAVPDEAGVAEQQRVGVQGLAASGGRRWW